MRDSIPSAGYSPICNVLRQWNTSLIPINFIESTDSMITSAKIVVIKKFLNTLSALTLF